MRTVEDEEGTRYLLLAESGDSSRVRDPETGRETYLPNDELNPVEGESPLVTAASGLPDASRRFVTAVRDERGLGLLADLAQRGPTAARTMLDAYDLCESDLHGLLAEFRAAGLIAETEVGGRRGYRLTDRGAAILDRLRSVEE